MVMNDFMQKFPIEMLRGRDMSLDYVSYNHQIICNHSKSKSVAPQGCTCHLEHTYKINNCFRIIHLAGDTEMQARLTPIIQRELHDALNWLCQSLHFEEAVCIRVQRV